MFGIGERNGFFTYDRPKKIVPVQLSQKSFWLLKDEANLEIIEAYLYYEEQCTGLGEEFLDHLDASFDRFTANPKHFHKIGNLFGLLELVTTLVIFGCQFNYNIQK